MFITFNVLIFRLKPLSYILYSVSSPKYSIICFFVKTVLISSLLTSL